jgi:hypothetical protein
VESSPSLPGRTPCSRQRRFGFPSHPCNGCYDAPPMVITTLGAPATGLPLGFGGTRLWRQVPRPMGQTVSLQGWGVASAYEDSTDHLVGGGDVHQKWFFFIGCYQDGVALRARTWDLQRFCGILVPLEFFRFIH